MKVDFLKDMVELFKALGNEVRLKIVQTLVRNELNVTQLVKIMGTSQSSISQHLAVLRKAKILKTRRDSQIIYYSIACKKTLKIILILEEMKNERY